MLGLLLRDVLLGHLAHFAKAAHDRGHHRLQGTLVHRVIGALAARLLRQRILNVQDELVGADCAPVLDARHRLLGGVQIRQRRAVHRVGGRRAASQLLACLPVEVMKLGLPHPAHHVTGSLASH